jgi:hypothetical protein
MGWQLIAQLYQIVALKCTNLSNRVIWVLCKSTGSHVSLISGDSDVSTLSPRSSPGVFDDPKLISGSVSSITYEQNCVVDRRAFSTSEYSTLIALKFIGIESNCNLKLEKIISRQFHSNWAINTYHR